MSSQGMVPPGMQQLEAVQGPSPQPSLHHEDEEHSMPVADHGSQEESALPAEASSGSSGQAAQQDDRWDSQQEEALPQHEAPELDTSRYPQQEQHQAVEQEEWQQDDRPGYQQLPDLANRQEAASVD